MPTVEERIARLEGRVEEHSQLFVMMREALGSLERRMDARFDAVDRRFDAIDRRFEAIDRRFDTADTRFAWLIGLYVTSILAFAVALFTRT